MKIITQPNLNNNGVIIQIQVLIENTSFLWVCATFSKSIQICANFTIGVIENETGHLLECVELYGKFINKNED